MTLRRLAATIRGLFTRARTAADLQEEMGAHLAMEEQENREAGMSRDEAHYAALRRFGNVVSAQERSREMWGWTWLEALAQDIRYGLRQLRRNPGFTLVAVLTLALGIGASTAIFSIINVLLLTRLPYPASERIVALPASGFAVSGLTITSYTKLTRLREQTRTLESVGAFYIVAGSLLLHDSPEQIAMAHGSLEHFELFGMTPALGRSFLPEEDKPGGPAVAMITDGFWRTHFGGDPSIVGKSMVLNGAATTIVGVLPASFHFPFAQPEPVVWLPRVFENPNYSLDRIHQGVSYLLIYGRLRPGVSAQQAQAEVEAFCSRYRAELGNAFDAALGLRVESLPRNLVGDLRPALLAVSAAVGFVLLIVCVNVAGLLLARATARQHEVAVRRAIGATRGRLIRQFLVESVCLSILGGCLGVLVAGAGVPILMHSLTPGTIPLSEEIRVDGSILLYAVLLCTFTGVAFGLLPALHASRTELQEKLREGSRGSTGGAQTARLRAVMVVVEVALAVVLTAGAGLLLHSLANLMRVNPGFQAGNVNMFSFALERTKYPQQSRANELYRDFLEQVRRLPGVQSAAYFSPAPLSGGARFVHFCAEGTPCQGVKDPIAAWHQASSDLFSTLKITMIQGRGVLESDTTTSPRVVVINRALADRYFPNVNPLGRHIVNSRDGSSMEIVGVVGNLKYNSLSAPDAEEIYVPYTQDRWPLMTLMVRSQSGSALVAPVRSIAHALDPELPQTVQPLGDLVTGSMAQPKLIAQLVTAFAVVALFLAALGIYGVMAYLVAQRSREIAIRLALGSPRGRVFQLVLKQGLRMAVAGVFLGLAGSLAITRLLSAMLFETSATDPLTLGGSCGLFVVVALLACYVPARRATLVDAQTALRCQ